MRSRLLAPIVFVTATACPVGVAAQQPWIDAGQQAMIMHQGDLLEQQTTQGDDDVEDADGDTEALVASPNPDAKTAGLACAMEREREKLRPEYERRLRADGRLAADAWLRQEAAVLGQQAGERAKAGEKC